MSPENEFSEETFPALLNYCFQYREVFISYENFGRTLEKFADMGTQDVCYEGLKSLYSNHRDKPSTWFYIISNFGNIKEEGIRRNILGLLSNYTNNPHVFWHTSNMKYYQKKEDQVNISQLMAEYFRVKELKLTLPYMKDGINRGSFSFLVFLVIDLIKDVHILLKKISFEEGLEHDERNFWFWLYMHLAKYKSVDETLKTIDQYLAAFPFGYKDEAILGVKESIENGQLLPVG